MSKLIQLHNNLLSQIKSSETFGSTQVRKQDSLILCGNQTKKRRPTALLDAGVGLCYFRLDEECEGLQCICVQSTDHLSVSQSFNFCSIRKVRLSKCFQTLCMNAVFLPGKQLSCWRILLLLAQGLRQNLMKSVEISPMVSLGFRLLQATPFSSALLHHHCPGRSSSTAPAPARWFSALHSPRIPTLSQLESVA